ncbi:hypothetical protein [Pontibacter liquoris]|uniref:hypothetical protein n=1 Tax=Pontibacter liquoris TaxID=2905677 RepID=UPI001FA6B543|nr:hypothetical protein [Pontibacter liquoris]
MEDKQELTALVTVLSQLRQEGYTEDFTVSDDGFLCTIEGDGRFTPEQVQIVNFYRFEGESNPDDMAILYVVETADGRKGTISDAFGTYSDETVSNFMKQVEDLGKDLDKAGKK